MPIYSQAELLAHRHLEAAINALQNHGRVALLEILRFADLIG